MLPPRLASKVCLVLNAAGVGDVSAVRDALLTGALGAGVADWPKTLRELCDAGVFPSAADLVAIRTAYVRADTGAARAPWGRGIEASRRPRPPGRSRASLGSWTTTAPSRASR